MSTIASEINYILDSKEDVAASLIKKFGVQAVDVLNSDGSVAAQGLSYSDGTIKRLSEWQEAIDASNIYWADQVLNSSINPDTTPRFGGIGIGVEYLNGYAINTNLPVKINYDLNPIQMYTTSSTKGCFIDYNNVFRVGEQSSSFYWKVATGINGDGSIMYNKDALSLTSAGNLTVGNNISVTGSIINNSINAKLSTSAISSYSTSNALIPTYKTVWDAIQLNMEDAHKEALLTWGGKDFSNSYGCLDSALIDNLRCNRLAFAKADGITIEYSEDSGSTWQTYSTTNAVKLTLTSVGDVAINFRGPTNTKAQATDKQYLRVTFDTGTCGIYTTLNKFAFYISTNGSNNVTVSIYKALQNSPTSFVAVKENVPISGWAGWNIVNVPAFTTYGLNSSTQYGKIRFVFKQGTSSSVSTYGGADVRLIQGFGGVGWTAPSNLAKIGHLYNYDYNQNAIFPKAVYASGFVITSNASADNLLVSNGTVISKTALATAISPSITVPLQNTLTTVGDKRSTATTPNDYSNKLIFQGLKQAKTTLGIATAASNYAYLIGLRGWSDSSGGNAVELAFCAGSIYTRSGATTTWGSWKELVQNGSSPSFTSISVSGSAEFTGDTLFDSTVDISDSLSGVDATFSANVQANAFYETSDINLKQNIKDISDIDKASKIKFKEFEFKKEGIKKYGVIAQDLEEIELDNLINTKNECLSVDYISLLCLKMCQLEKEIQELKKQLK